MTQGQGTFEMSFARYEMVPPNVANEIIAKFKAEHGEEEDRFPHLRRLSMRHSGIPGCRFFIIFRISVGAVHFSWFGSVTLCIRECFRAEISYSALRRSIAGANASLSLFFASEVS